MCCLAGFGACRKRRRGLSQRRSLRALSGDAALFILEVWGPDEFTGPLGHIREATNMPLNELPADLPDLVRGNRPVVVVCKTDRRSSTAARQFQEAGMSDVSVLRGGMERWRVVGLPASPAPGISGGCLG